MNVELRVAGARVNLCLGAADSTDDVCVTGTAAEVSSKIFADLVVGRILIFFEKGFDGKHEARRAVGTLQRALFDEGLLNFVQQRFRLQPLQRGDRAGSAHRQQQA